MILHFVSYKYVLQRYIKVTYMTVPYPISILEKILSVGTIVIEECMKCSYIDGPVGGYQHHNAVKSVTI